MCRGQLTPTVASKVVQSIWCALAGLVEQTLDVSVSWMAEQLADVLAAVEKAITEKGSRGEGGDRARNDADERVAAKTTIPQERCDRVERSWWKSRYRRQS